MVGNTHSLPENKEESSSLYIVLTYAIQRLSLSEENWAPTGRWRVVTIQLLMRSEEISLGWTDSRGQIKLCALTWCMESSRNRSHVWWQQKLHSWNEIQRCHLTIKTTRNRSQWSLGFDLRDSECYREEKTSDQWQGKEHLLWPAALYHGESVTRGCRCAPAAVETDGLWLLRVSKYMAGHKLATSNGSVIVIITIVWTMITYQ